MNIEFNANYFTGIQNTSKASLFRSISIYTLIALFLTACGGDPFEERGDYDLYTQLVDVPNPEITSDPMSGRLFAPSSDGGDSIISGEHGLLVFTPGFGADYSWYREYGEHLSSHGFIVLLMSFSGAGFNLEADHPYQARQIGYAIDHALTLIPNSIDEDKIAVGGHSFGGKIAFFTATMDSRISAVLAMDPSNAGGAPCFISPDTCGNFPVAPNPTRGEVGLLEPLETASLIMRAEPDLLGNPDEEFNASHFFYGYDGNGLYAVNSPAIYFDMGDTPHNSWVPTLFREVPTVAKRTMLAFLKKHFSGENTDRYLTGSKVRADISAGIITAVDSR